MLFMGEEWGADTPWQFFTDHTDPFFAEAVSNGRRSEFAAHGWGFADVPDPQDKETFLRSKLDWTQPGREPYRSLLGWYRSLLALRRSRPELTDPRLDQVRVEFDEDDALARRAPGGAADRGQPRRRDARPLPAAPAAQRDRATSFSAAITAFPSNPGAITHAAGLLRRRRTPGEPAACARANRLGKWCAAPLPCAAVAG